MQRTLEAIRRDGDSSAVADLMPSFKDREAIIGTEHWNDLNEEVRGMSGRIHAGIRSLLP